MYSRNVSLKLKADSAPEFARTLEKEIIPLLRKQKGFQDEITFVAPERNEAIAISFWDKKESAEAYSRERYPEVLKVLSKVIEGDPRVETFEVANSTSHQIVPSAVN
jgi:heme-degrading monooxygenase HmoA